MTIVARLEKIKFIIDEMRLAFRIAQHAPDDAEARMLVRHVLVRADDLIAHARQLRKPLNNAGFHTSGFHRAKEAYAGFFDEYFQVPRDRLGAHIQDLDFGRRIELWNDIETVKVSFFVDGAKEIHEALHALGIPGLLPYAEPSEFADDRFTARLLLLKQSAEGGAWAELGADPLALTRPNTVSALNQTPIHARAGQLSLIRRWIKSQRRLLQQFAAFPGVERILKARLITDIVSFCDCLVTRQLLAGAPQALDGLDKLLVATGASAAPIHEFQRVYSFDVALRTARDVRDRIGAHLEADEAVTLSSLLLQMDSFDLPATLSFYESVAGVFEKVCREVLFLRLYLADGQRIHGVTPSGAPVTPFDPRDSGRPTPQPRIDTPTDDEESYRRKLETWLTGNADEREMARHEFWHAFMHSAVVESIPRSEYLLGCLRQRTLEFRKVHEFLHKVLCSDPPEARVFGILDLLVRCKASDPMPLSELLIRYAATPAAKKYAHALCYCLGELATQTDEAAHEVLADCVTTSADPNVALQARNAILKIFVRTEGMTRINAKRTILHWNDVIGPLFRHLLGLPRLLCLTSFASQFSGPLSGSYRKSFSEEFDSLKKQIVDVCQSELKPEAFSAISDLLHKLLETDDFVGLCLLLADPLVNDGRQPDADVLLRAACSGLVIAAPHDQAKRHLAGCLLRIRVLGRALEIAEDLARRNPDNIGHQLLVAQIVAEMPSAAPMAREIIGKIKLGYRLTDQQQAIIDSLETQLGSGQS